MLSMTPRRLYVIRNSFAVPNKICFRRHYEILRSEHRYSEWGLRGARGARVGFSGAIGVRVYSVTRSLRYLYTACPTFTILKEKVTMPENKPFQRLPKHVIPKHYCLELVPNLENFNFKGKTAVKVSVRENFTMTVANINFHVTRRFLIPPSLSDCKCYKSDSAKQFRFGIEKCVFAIQK